MNRILIFGGTTEGRLLAQFCEDGGIPAVVSVVSDYGKELLRDMKQLTIAEGGRSETEMEELIRSSGVSDVFDATHPYAAEASANISRACAACRVPYRRVLRESEDEEAADGAVVHVPSVAAAVSLLKKTAGNILLLTGSREAGAFAELGSARLFARVLPDAASLEACRAAGIEPSHIAAMQGPFSEEMNRALIHHFGCSYAVTKESGRAGGFAEKIAACRDTGTVAVVIGRPAGEEGISLKEAESLLEEMKSMQK